MGNAGWDCTKQMVRVRDRGVTYYARIWACGTDDDPPVYLP
jgi:hypothetical protein